MYPRNNSTQNVSQLMHVYPIHVRKAKQIDMYYLIKPRLISFFLCCVNSRVKCKIDYWNALIDLNNDFAFNLGKFVSL